MKRHALKILIGISGLILLWILTPKRGKEDASGAHFGVRRGNLSITVTEGGSIEALESQEIRSEVKGYQGTKILSIVEEGYQVTEEDVKKGKILVELDSSEIKQKITTQEIQFQSTTASLIEAKNAYDIQVNQNLSDLKAAELKMKFARMDAQKFLGTRVVETIFERLGVKEPARIDVTRLPSWAASQLPGSAGATTNRLGLAIGGTPLAASPGNAGTGLSSGVLSDPPPLAMGKVLPLPPLPAEPRTGPVKRDESAPKPPVEIDFAQFGNEEVLGDGEAAQKIREGTDKWLVAKTDLGLAETKLEGTKRLFEKNFVTQTQLDNDQVQVEKARVQVKSAKTALELFKKYGFPKQAEELVSKFEEAVLALEKTQKEAISKLAQAEAKLKSTESRYRIERNQLDDLHDQLNKCVLKAKRPGLVTYGGSRRAGFYYGQEQIREGATVRQRQPIITIPDMTKMGVNVKIHESHINKIKIGMKARIRIESFPEEPLEGEVIKVGVLPDSENRWMNPDLKVYKTTLRIDRVQEWLKPGMTAKVEIFVNELEDVVYVPIQAVFAENKVQVCYLAGRHPERRVVETGEYNDEFIEIKHGLKLGDVVMLKAPPGKEDTFPNPDEERAPGAEPTSGQGGPVPEVSL